MEVIEFSRPTIRSGSRGAGCRRQAGVRLIFAAKEAEQNWNIGLGGAICG